MGCKAGLGCVKWLSRAILFLLRLNSLLFLFEENFAARIWPEIDHFSLFSF